MYVFTKQIKRVFLTSLLLFCVLLSNASDENLSVVSGKVSDDQTELAGANIMIVGKIIGAVSDLYGNFTLRSNTPPPYIIRISMVGYEPQEVEITEASTSELDIVLDISKELLASEIVISGSRVEESILESPVSIQKINLLGIRNTASHDFYAGLRDLNGIDILTQSLTFHSLNVRGFGSSGNNRFVQLIDNIDNQAPGLNFPVGNVVGISELDLESIELLSGTASALYGPNAIQGIMLMSSKSPFEYQGLDISTKLGVNHVDGLDDDPALYQDYAFRYAQQFGSNFAFKLTGAYMRANDFIGVDYRDQSFINRGGTIEGSLDRNRQNNRFYDGINVYGDPTINIAQFVPELAGIFSSNSQAEFTPTGFLEKDILDNRIHSLKVGTALHYRLNDDIEVVGQFNYGTGTTIHTPEERLVFDNFTVWTAKAEIRGSNFFARAYQTKEDAGDSYSANAVADLINADYYATDYIEAFVNAVGGSNTVEQAHSIARGIADDAQLNGNDRHQAYVAGTPEFDRLVNLYRSQSINEGGAKLIDKSSLFHYEAGYNFKSIKWAEVIAGGNFRTYALNSEGTLFTQDRDGNEVSYDEYGGYVQIKKRFWDQLAVYGSMRFDKNVNFDGQFSPRLSTVWEYDKSRFLRASYQRGFRLPTAQDQYIDIDLITRRVIGRNDLVMGKYNFDKNVAYTAESVETARITGDVNDLEISSDIYTDHKAETIGTWEIGHKGLYMNDDLFIDVFAYQSVYSNILAGVEGFQAVASDNIQQVPSGDGYDFGSEEGHTNAEKQIIINDGVAGEVNIQKYLFHVNATQDVTTRGFGAAVEYSFAKGYLFGVNSSYNKLTSLNELIASKYNVKFNSPEWRFSVKLSNRRLTEKLGFNVSYHWQDAFLRESPASSGIVPAFGTVDAQVTYRIPSLKARLKVGGSNILNKRYSASFPNPRLGALYYIQLNFDNVLESL